MRLTNLILPGRGTSNRFDIEISESENRIVSINPTSEYSSHDSPPSRVLPTLCHPHIHLDKPFLLTAHNDDKHLPNYLDLAPEDGSFAEALSKTGQAKQRYTHDDLVRRGSQLIAESIQAGVSSMRAFVEVDHVVNLKCLVAGIELKRLFSQHCHVQICLFAQDPVIDPDKSGPANREKMEEALDAHKSEIDVLGSTPYVEGSDEMQQQNIVWAVEHAISHKLHLDFHLDYNLNSNSQSMIHFVIRTLRNHEWTRKCPGKTVVIGHCTRMTLFTNEEMKRLANEIHDAQLPIYFVGLPTSDLFMMGRPTDGSWGGARPRGTLQVLELIKSFQLNACIGINNIGNAFTPWGSADPLRLASLAVGIYQAGTPKDAELLFECVSALAQEAIGLKEIVVRSLEEGAQALFMVIENKKNIEIGAFSVPARKRLSVADMIWDPPELHLRTVVGRAWMSQEVQ